MPKCKHCKEKFTTKYFNQKYCMNNIECIAEFRNKLKEQQQQQKQKEWNKRKAKLKEELKSKSDHLNDLQIIINSIAREIDKGSNCMMCGCVMKKSNGCHYHSVGSKPSLRFNLLNIWIGCESCNNFKGGNINGYDEQLIKYYGREKWDVIKFDLPRSCPTLKLSIPEIEVTKKKAKEILKEIKSLPPMKVNDRWTLRLEVNKNLNIY